MRRIKLTAVLLAAVLLFSLCSCGGSPFGSTEDSARKKLSKYSDLPLSGEGTGIGMHDDEYGFHIVNRAEFVRPEHYASKNVAHSYQTLSTDEQREAYDQIIDACYCFSDKKEMDDRHYTMRPVILRGADFDYPQMESTLVAVFDDHPEIFWMDYIFEMENDEKTGTTALTLFSLFSSDEVLRMMGEIDDALQAFYADVPDGLSEYEREVYVYKNIIDHCEYDDNIEENDLYESEHPELYTLYGALVNHKAVCEGYSYAFDYLSSQLGVDTVCICGTAENTDTQGNTTDELHQWNAVMLDGEWYMADITWDDADQDEDIRDVFIYLNIPQSVMERDHKLDKTYAQITEHEYWMLPCYINNFLPSCTAAEYSYYLREGVTLSEPDVDKLSEAIIRAAEKKSSALMVNVDSGQYTLTQFSDALFDGDQPYYQAMEKAYEKLGDVVDPNADAIQYFYDDRSMIAFEMPYRS